MHRKACGDDVSNSTSGDKNYCVGSNGNAADALILCASQAAQADLSEFFKKWNPGVNAYQLSGATGMSFQDGVSSLVYNTLASLKLPKPGKGPEVISKVTEHKMSVKWVYRPSKASTPHPAWYKMHRANTHARCTGLSGLEEGHMAYTRRSTFGKLQQTTFNRAF